MAIPLLRQYDAQSRIPFINAAPGTAAGQVVVYEQLQAAIEGISWKDNVRVRASTNITIASPGATIDGITMATNDRVLLDGQTTTTEKGLWIWNGAATPMTRALDASTFDEMESAVVTVDEGTSGGTTWRQTQVNGVIGTNAFVFSAFGTGASSATETTSGIAEIATQAETDTGSDDARIVTPLKLKTSPYAAKRYSAAIGDGTATSIVVTHNLNSNDVEVSVRETGGSKRLVICEVQITSVNTVTVLFDLAPTASQYTVAVSY